MLLLLLWLSINPSYNQLVRFRLSQQVECDIQHGFYFEDWLTVKKISAEIHDPQNKTTDMVRTM